jgi:tRNA-dihydrouridine synthase A
MMDYTDRFCRYFLRLISRETLLYTEMVTTGALIHGDRARFLAFDPSEHPVAIQLGGSDPGELARCADFAQKAGFDEVNLNCGCPSDRVKSGRFGASLMQAPDRVADAVAAMADSVSIPVTVKHRIGVDNLDSYDYFRDFVGRVAEAGCKTFIVHARKAWLNGLSPKQNREIPPLKYDYVYRLKEELPDLEIVLNGGVRTLDEAEKHLRHVDGVMIGREAYQNPYMLTEVDSRFYGCGKATAGRDEILETFADYVEREMQGGTRLSHMTRHILGLYNGQPGARRFRRYISEQAHLPQSGAGLIRQAMAARKGVEHPGRDAA